MKYLLSALPLVCLFLVSCAEPYRNVSGAPTVTANGHAEIRILPDEGVISLGVETLLKTLEASKADNDSRVAAVIASVEALGISKEHIRTDYYSVEPVYAQNHHYSDDFVGYRARKTIVVTLRDLLKLEELLSNSLESGASHIHGVDFKTTQLRKYRDQARVEAIKAAREKAELMANELGRHVGEVKTISEGYNRWWSGYGAYWGRRHGGGMAQNVIQSGGSSPEGGDGSTAPGQIAVTAQATVVFVLADGPS